MAIDKKNTLDNTFHALGDATRREILSMLANKGACSANQLRAPFNVAQPTISKHLKVLEQAGLVRREVRGRIHRFELQLEAMNEASEWISLNRQFWENTLSRLDSFLDGFEPDMEDL